MALKHLLTGTVNNTTNGVHIYCTGPEERIQAFYDELKKQPPVNALVTRFEAASIPLQHYNDFSIIESSGHAEPELLLTPDFGLCAHCREELFDEKNRRFQYPFITCTECGPRYSIITSLPYDRHFTTMKEYEQCWHCKKEYHDPMHRRYYSQTNSCNDCGIPMHLYNKEGEIICEDTDCILILIKDALLKGHIVAVKGIGGYLLLCDATNYLAIAELRERKHRPAKPLAVLYPSLAAAAMDVVVSANEQEALESNVSPIVLCEMKPASKSGLCKELLAPGLNKLGVLLPYAPLLALIADAVSKPLVATSGNLSGSPIIYEDEQALEFLGDFADFFLTYDRDIVVPQDDSVVQFSKEHQHKIILRRSRGLAPNYLPVPFQTNASVFAMGSELKNSFALLQNHRCYISQYLGNQGSYDAQQAFRKTTSHLTQLLNFEADLCISDQHPGYHSTAHAKEYATLHSIPLVEVQHHEAHAAAVLAENNLLHAGERVLCVVWDGTGFGKDGNIWGGEFFLFENTAFKRIAHLDLFPVLLGDKMMKEPRLAAFSLTQFNESFNQLLATQFTTREMSFYKNKLQNEHSSVFTSSMGRLLDGIASLLGICDVMSYEGEAAMKLEALAAKDITTTVRTYRMPLYKTIVYWNEMLVQIIDDLSKGISKEEIALTVHRTLAQVVRQVAEQAGVEQIAFSGGVFQNSLLVDLLINELQKDHRLYFHQQLSPNDECISFGQLAHTDLQLQEQPAFYKTIQSIY
jgi:hydrogenase maturation protein HypF